MSAQFRQFGQTRQLYECASKVDGLWLALFPHRNAVSALFRPKKIFLSSLGVYDSGVSLLCYPSPRNFPTFCVKSLGGMRAEQALFINGAQVCSHLRKARQEGPVQ